MTIVNMTTPAALVAHRGASLDAPENTLQAYNLAADLGFEWIEVDCQITQDHVPVMIHDSKLDRTTNGKGFIIDTSFAALRELDASAGHNLSEAISIPTLEETLDLVMRRNLGLVLEIKPIWGRDLEHARAVAAVLRNKWQSGYDHLIVSSFSALCLQEIRRLLPETPIAMAVEILPEYPQDYIDLLGNCGFHVQYKGLTQAAVDAVHSTGAHISAATVNDPTIAQKILCMGVQSVMTDSADLLRLEGA